jgi:hypothetical protein
VYTPSPHSWRDLTCLLWPVQSSAGMMTWGLGAREGRGVGGGGAVAAGRAAGRRRYSQPRRRRGGAPARPPPPPPPGPPPPAAPAPRAARPRPPRRRPPPRRPAHLDARAARVEVRQQVLQRLAVAVLHDGQLICGGGGGRGGGGGVDIGGSRGAGGEGHAAAGPAREACAPSAAPRAARQGGWPRPHAGPHSPRVRDDAPTARARSRAGAGVGARAPRCESSLTAAPAAWGWRGVAAGAGGAHGPLAGGPGPTVCARAAAAAAEAAARMPNRGGRAPTRRRRRGPRRLPATRTPAQRWGHAASARSARRLVRRCPRRRGRPPARARARARPRRGRDPPRPPTWGPASVRATLLGPEAPGLAARLLISPLVAALARDLRHLRRPPGRGRAQRPPEAIPARARRAGGVARRPAAGGIDRAGRGRRGASGDGGRVVVAQNELGRAEGARGGLGRAGWGCAVSSAALQ